MGVLQMREWHKLLEDIINNGQVTRDRTGVGTISVFGRQLRFDVSHQFPAVTTKKLAWKSVVGELLWFLEGSSNVNRLREITHGSEFSEKKTIWDANYENQARSLGYEEGELGPIYGVQWRDWLSYSPEGSKDQIQNLIDDILKQKETGIHNRRLLVSSWNPAEIKHMALPPCHYSFQMYLHNNTLSMMWNQRSVDTFLGWPFNVASYALLLNILCKITDTIPGELVFNGADCHIYENHTPQVHQVLKREPKELPVLEIVKDIKSLKDLKKCTVDDFVLNGYKHHGTVKAPMAV